AAAMAVVFAANPEPMLAFIYPPRYVEAGGPALVALALGTVAFAVFAISGTILNGAGLTAQALVTGAATVACTVAANWIVIPRAEPGRGLLAACASATGASMLVGAALGGVLLRRHLGAFVPARSLVRVAVAAVAGIAVGHAIPFSSRIGTLVEAVVVALAFFTTLVATRELGGDDLRRLVSVVRRRKETP